MKKYFNLFLFIFICSAFYAQVGTNGAKGTPIVPQKEVTKRDEFFKIFNEMEGTFQFILKDDSKKPLLSKELLEKIKYERQFSQPTYLEIEEGITIFIPSSSELSSPTFEKLKMEVVRLKTIDYENK